MTKRENIKITTPEGVAIELKPYLDARTSQANKGIYLGYAKVNMKQAIADAQAGKEASGADAVNFDDLPASVMTEVKNSTIRGMVMSVDGNNFDGDKDQILDAVLDLPESEYDFIQSEIDKIVGGTTLDPKDEQK